METNKIFTLNTNFILKGINKKFWALNTETGSQYRLNELSFDILSAIDGQTTIGMIIENQLKKYAVERDVLTNDIFKFIEIAMEKGFIKE